MPTLAGSRLVDASGNPVVDASGAYITEAALVVTVGPGGVLLTQQGDEIPTTLRKFWEDFQNAVDLGEWLVNQAVLANITNGIAQLIEEHAAYTVNWSTLQSTLSWLSTEQNYNLGSIMTAISAIDPGGGLTTEEHDALLALSNVDVEYLVGQIWGYVLAVENLTATWGGLSADQVVGNIFNGIMAVLGWQGIRLPDNPHFALIGQSPTDVAQWVGNYLSSSSFPAVPHLELSTIITGDTAISWLQREYPTYDWQTNFPTSTSGATGVFLSSGGDPPTHGYRLLLTDGDVKALWPLTIDPADLTVNVPPVWPGLDGATVGDAVALIDGLEVDGPLDGLLVHISATPSRAGRFGFGTVSSWRYVGAVIFQSDRGDWEWAQPIGLDDQVVTPASMTHAAAAKFRLEGGFAGTVRPFTVGV